MLLPPIQKGIIGLNPAFLLPGQKLQKIFGFLIVLNLQGSPDAVIEICKKKEAALRGWLQVNLIEILYQKKQFEEAEREAFGILV